MKKEITFLICLCLLSTFTFAQVDSATAYNLIQLGGHIATSVHPAPFIKGVDNGVLSYAVGLITSGIIALIHRRRTIKKWKRSGKIVS